MKRLSRLLALAFLLSFLWCEAARPESAEIRGDPVQAVAAEHLVRTAMTTSGSPIPMPEGPVELVASRYRIGPRAVLPPHRHPYPRHGYVMAGSLAVTNLETGYSRFFRAGDVIVEDVGAWHEARNLETQPVQLVVFDLVKSGADNVEMRK